MVVRPDTGLPGGSFLTRRGALLGMLALAGCATPPIVFDRANLASIKRVAVLTPGFPDRPTVAVLPPTNGALFVLINMAQQSNRSSEFAEFVTRAKADPEAGFSRALMACLQKAGLQPSPASANPRRTSLLEEYASVTPQGADAVLDVVVIRYGYYAVVNSAPFQPSVTMLARLVDARSRAVLMQEPINMVNMVPTDPAIINSAFQNYSDIAANPDGAVRALQSAMDTAASTICKRLA